jgi:hypothetical protein
MLRAMTRWVAPNARERDCGVMCIERTDEHPHVEIRNIDGAPRAKWTGLLTCGHIWTCPVCSQGLRSERAERVVRAVDHLGGRWQMLTLTLRHRQGFPLKDLRDGLMAAWRRTRQGGCIQRVWTERVSASVRAQEITYGENGWHPHIHVLLQTTEWDEDERDALQARWEAAVVRELGEHCRPDDLHGLVWSEPFDASRDSGARATYLTKLGLETTGLAKEGRHGSKTPWDVARAAALGESRSLWLWREFATATKGKRMIELDDRAQAAAKRALELACDGEDAGVFREVARIEVKRDDVRALRHIERRIGAIMAIVLRAAETGGESAVRTWIAYARANAWKPAVRKAPAPATPQREAG